MLTDAAELPTFVAGTLTWGDSGADADLDLSDVTSPGASGSVSRTLTHNYTQPGEYEVTVSLRNLVSQASLTKTVSFCLRFLRGEVEGWGEVSWAAMVMGKF